MVRRYMHKLVELQVAYEALEESAQMQARMESELRTDLEDQLRAPPLPRPLCHTDRTPL